MKLGETANPPSGSLQRDIMAAIRSVLEADAYRFADATASADFLVSFTVGSRESSKPDSQAEREPGASGRGGWGTAYYGGASESYLQGILVIDFYDAAERRPVWHGASTTKITEQDRENMPQVINAIVDTILSEFPPN